MDKGENNSSEPPVIHNAFGDNAFYSDLLELTDLSDGKTVMLDFAAYKYADDYVQEDFDFIGQRIIYAKVEDQVLYVATGHNTYAASCPYTGYITAIDLSDYHVIWKSEPLTCNSYSFEIIDGYIVCGYGFTAEDDFLKIVDTSTGLVVSEVPIRTMAEYIIYKDGKLFVRTYNMDYVFAWN